MCLNLLWFIICLRFQYFVIGIKHETTSPVFERLLLDHSQLDLTPLDIFHSPIVQHAFSSDQDIQYGEHTIEKAYRTSCPPFDSCISRCGNSSEDFKYSCKCDSMCSFYGDCCSDFQLICGQRAVEDLNQRNFVVEPICDLFLNTFPILMVAECPRNWTGDSTRKLCSTSLPIKCIVPDLFSDDKDCDATFYQRCWKRLASVCDDNIGDECPKLIAKECKEITLNVCKNCQKSSWPVVGMDKVLYRNSHCAVCNSQTNYTRPHLQSFLNEVIAKHSSSLFQVRRCFENIIDSCDSKSILSGLCSSFSGPVRQTFKDKKPTVFKNIYCAQCHNVSLQLLKCTLLPDPTSYSSLDVQKPTIWDLFERDGNGIKIDDIPASFSMLLNFGLDGRQRVYISSEGDETLRKHQHMCPKGFIFDPFSHRCRKLHCSTEFVLVDYECIKKDTSVDEISPKNISIPIPDADSDFVHLTLSAEIELIDFLQFHGQDIDGIKETIRQTISTSFNITLERIKNLRFNVSLGNSKDQLLLLAEIDDVSHPVSITIDFDLYESAYVNKTDSEPSVDSIVSMLASAVSINGYEFDVYNISGRIYDIQQTVDFLRHWCDPRIGKKTEYWNSEFKMILNENSSLSAVDRLFGIYVNKTQKFYRKGEFVANILYQGSQYNTNSINVSGVAIVCDLNVIPNVTHKTQLNESCVRIILERDEYVINNGSLFVLNASLSNFIDDSLYEEGENGSVIVCFSRRFGPKVSTYNLNMDLTQALVSYILSLISITAMVIVLATYTFFSSLRNLPGCNTMNLTFSLLVMQITFNFGERDSVTDITCKGVAIFLHYIILCCFMWMNIMAYDLFKTFGAKTVLNNIRSKGKYLPRYILYAYGTPFLLILVTFLMDYFLEDSDFSPGYGDYNVCWITSRYAAMAYFALPLAIVMCINFGFLIFTIRSIQSVKQVLQFNLQKKQRTGKRHLLIYARMAFVIGLTWTLAFAAAYVDQEKLTGKILTYLFIVFNTLQGVFIFCAFVCNRRVYELYRNALRKMYKLFSGSPTLSKTSSSLYRIANVMHRTVSTDTVVSVISNSSTDSNEPVLSLMK